MGVPSDRQFLGLVAKVLPGWFPHLPCQSQYNRRLRRFALDCGRAAADRRACRDERALLADGTLIGVANYAGCASRSDFAGAAAYGYCASKSQFMGSARPYDRPRGRTGRVHAGRRQREGVRAGA